MRVLVVDDEPVARMLHVSMLGRMQDVAVAGVGSVAEARASLASSWPDVIILDLQLPDGTGLDVLVALAERRLGVNLVVVTGYLEEPQGPLPRSRRVPVLRKPVSMRELQALVERFRQEPAPPTPFALLEYAQLACMSQQSAVLECVAADGSSVGQLAIERGVPWSAHDSSGSGLAALHRLSALEGCDIRVLPASSRSGSSGSSGNLADPGPGNLTELAGERRDKL